MATGGLRCRELPKVYPNSFAFAGEICPISLAELPDGNLLTVDRTGTPCFSFGTCARGRCEHRCVY